VRCPGCGTDNRSGAKFCDDCGTALATAAAAGRGPRGEREDLAAPEAGSRRAAPIAYTPRHLAERILAEQQALEARGAPDGERKTITALFADIKGSMDLLEDLDPEAARQIIDPALQP
jgi:class 3 adenylate cyclase